MAFEFSKSFYFCLTANVASHYKNKFALGKFVVQKHETDSFLSASCSKVHNKFMYFGTKQI